MSGVSFTPPPYVPHVANIIKQSDELRVGGSVIDDSELLAVLRPSTIYRVRIMLMFAGTETGLAWRPACTQTVDFASLLYHRPVQSNAGDVWDTGSAGDHVSHAYDTTIFNAGTPNFNAAQQMGRSCAGLIQTGSSGGTFSVKWGLGTSITLCAGSFMYLQEAAAY